VRQFVAACRGFGPARAFKSVEEILLPVPPVFLQFPRRLDRLGQDMHQGRTSAAQAVKRAGLDELLQRRLADNLEIDAFAQVKNAFEVPLFAPGPGDVLYST